ncbi:MAG: hypothetical protein OHM77_06840 [Candidatus Nitricoxidivorans perseverans]|uniref:Uncharacterized protein n=1 Tax=Candidatus Nitricoxidivorans perseverans TaxID=2975601 RepID=A0AA49FP34_9PROT|nr:MAG: hypothetical protein OHM77_06840 [Candidatus Nitricoxidivorans perseverans]
MPARRLLFLDASRLTAWHWSLGHLEKEGEFAADAAGLGAFGEYLRRHRASIWFLLTDVAEEGFQIEDVPYVTGRDRGDLIKRKLGQYFYGTPFSVAISLGRAKEGRRDEKLLFAALIRAQQFEPWLEILRQAEAQLAGVFSMPQAVAVLAAQLAARMGSEYRQFLLISATSGGLRQSFFEDGQLRFSRLTPLATGTVEETAIASAVEAAKIHHYLSAQRLINRSTALPALVLAHPVHLEAFHSRCHDTGDLHFEIVDLVAEAMHNGLKTLPKDSCGEELFLHLLVRQTPRQQFAPSSARRFYHLWQLRFALQSAGLVTLAACLLFAGKQVYEADALRQASAEENIQAAGERQRYDAILQTLPRIPLSTENLRALTSRYEELLKRGVGLEPATAHLSHALQDAPKIDLVRLEWRIANSPAEASDALPNNKPAAGANAGPFVIVDLFGQLPIGLVNDHRAQMSAIDAFAERLRTGSGIHEVRILSRPFEVESGKSLKSGSEAAGRAAEAPKFSLRIVWKL